jgi:hypothetical protein
VANLIKEKLTAEKAIEELYLAAYARLPSAVERAKALAYLKKQGDLRRGLEDLVWALLNSREFLFNH